VAVWLSQIYYIYIFIIVFTTITTTTHFIWATVRWRFGLVKPPPYCCPNECVVVVIVVKTNILQ